MTDDRLTATPVDGQEGLYILEYAWLAPEHPPATYTVEAKEVGATTWCTNGSWPSRLVMWQMPHPSKTGWQIRVTAETQTDGKYRSDMITLAPLAAKP